MLGFTKEFSVHPLCGLGLLAALGIITQPIHAREICTLIADAPTGDLLVKRGDCNGRVTPASTFKIPLALMAYDTGFLTSEHHPTFTFRSGYPDWGGDAWKQPTDPVRWLKYSVVWFSQQIARALGQKKLSAYASQFNYGTADFSGDSGKNNGLERAWIASSLKVSPAEQVAFLGNLVNKKLPVSDHAADLTLRIVERTTLSTGWTVHGKTGMAYPRKADYSFDEHRPWGWFVGWADKGGRRIVFARLIQDDQKTEGTAGVRSRDSFLQDLSGLVGK